MKIMNFSDRTMNAFEKFDTNAEGMIALMSDLALGKEIYDAETDKVISKSAADALVYAFNMEILGVTPEMIKAKDGKSIKRAIRDNGRDFYDIQEDVLDKTWKVGLQDSEWFNELVDTIGIAYGDRQDFVAKKHSILSVATAGTSHHDHVLQRLAPGQRYSIPTRRHVIKVGADINRYILQQVDWAEYMAAVNEALTVNIQEEIFASLAQAVALIPSQSNFVGTGALTTQANKDNFLAITDNVADANGDSNVFILGTRAALRKVSDVIDTTWIANSQKESRAETGLVGYAEGMTLVRVPNRFKDDTFTLPKIFDDKALYIFASDTSNKIIKFVNEGNLEVNEITEKGEQNGRWDDLMTYEVQGNYGAGVVPGFIFGKWTLP